MILAFSTQINGKSTYFVEKIHKGFNLPELNMKAAIEPLIHYPPGYNYAAKDKLHHKITTIREDEKNRWQPGVMIDFFINCRQKDMFRFAPRIPVVSVQNIIIKQWNGKPQVYIDDSPYPLERTQVVELAQNDGFDTVEDFFEYFNKDFTSKIIHWTDFKY